MILKALKPDPGNRRSPLAPRRAALALLNRVLRDRQPFDDAIDRPFSGLDDARDRRFAYAAAAVCLRRLGQIDAALAVCLDRPLAQKHDAVANILRLGAAQILFMDTPAYAAVDGSVTMTGMARKAGDRALKNMVNAVLRRLSREKDAIMSAQEDPARLNTPDWLWESWCQAYGEKQTRAIAGQHMNDAPLDLTVREPETRRDWEKKLDATWLPTGSLRLYGVRGPIEDLPGFAEGAWWVQDAAASLPARLLGAVAGATVIDMCAAPGGKTAQLAAAKCRVTALDKSAARLAVLRGNLKRIGVKAELIEADARRWRPGEPAQFVLLDAPCTATGTIRRHPDIARLKTPKDVATMTALQDELLSAAADYVATGGLLVYCTCSLQPEEGEERIEAFLRRKPAFERFPLTPRGLRDLPGVVTAQGDVRTLPCHLADAGGMDGFYIARLRRRTTT